MLMSPSKRAACALRRSAARAVPTLINRLFIVGFVSFVFIGNLLLGAGTNFLDSNARFCRMCGEPRGLDVEYAFEQVLSGGVDSRVYAPGVQMNLSETAGDEIVLVEKGRLAIYTKMIDATPVRNITAGGFWLKRNGARTAKVVAEEETSVLVLSWQTLEKFDAICPGLLEEIEQLSEADQTEAPVDGALGRTLTRLKLGRQGSNVSPTSLLTTVTLAAAKFKLSLVEKRHRQRLAEFKEQRKVWQNRRQTGALWTITLLTAVTSLVLGVCFGYIGTFRVDWWGRGCLEGEVIARESGGELLRKGEEALRCHTNPTTLGTQMWLVLGTCLMEAIANVLYVVVTDVDLNQWFDAHPLAFALLAGAQAVRAIGHAIFFPECWLVVLALLVGCKLCQGDNKLDKTDPLVAMMVVWPWALALQLVGWLSTYLSNNWPVTHGDVRSVDDASGCILISLDHFGYINLYLKRIITLLCALPLFFGSMHLLYRGFADSSASRSEAFKRVYRLVWFYKAWFWAVMGFLRIDGVVEWQPIESESRLFENQRYHSAAGLNDTLDHGGAEVHFDLTMAAFCFVPALLVQLFREQIWLWLARLFDQRQRLADGAFIAAMLTMQMGDGGLTEAALTKTARKTLRRVRWSKIEANPDVLAGRRFAGSRDDYDLSEPCEHGEIDFFISHVHADDAEAKFKELQAVAESFVSQHDREPTFWLDRACIDAREVSKQRTWSDQLKCLPIFVSSCSTVLILHSPNYVKRLWCIWELYLCFAMEVPVPRIRVLSLEPDRTITGTETGNIEPVWPSLAEQLQPFDVKHAHCTSKSHEITIRKAIRISGTHEFNLTIRQIADQLSKPVCVDCFGVSAGKLKGVHHAGYMEKRIGLHYGLKRCYFVAIDHHLYVFKGSSYSRWQHAISLAEGVVTPDSDNSLRIKFMRKNSHDDEYPYASDKSGEWHLRCCDSSDRDVWLAALQTATIVRSRSGTEVSVENEPEAAVPGNSTATDRTLGHGKRYHAFLTHAWGEDGSGRDNHRRVSVINDMLKQRGVITWCFCLPSQHASPSHA